MKRSPGVSLVLALALSLGGASAVFAQVRVATLEELRRELSPGDVISIVRTTGDPVKGRLRRFGDTDIDLRADIQELKIPLGAIRSLERPRDSTRNGALIGAGVGAGVSLAMFIHAAAIDRNEMDEWAAGYLAGGAITTAIGALAGWAIDRAHSKPHLRFVAAVRQP